MPQNSFSSKQSLIIPNDRLDLTRCHHKFHQESPQSVKFEQNPRGKILKLKQSKCSGFQLSS